MNAVKIEEAVTELASQSFDSKNSPYLFLEAFDNKVTTIKRLKSGSSNPSDIEDTALQRNNIPICMCEEGQVTQTPDKLKSSTATSKAKAKFVLVTDGLQLETEDLSSGQTIACCIFQSIRPLIPVLSAQPFHRFSPTDSSESANDYLTLYSA